MNATQQIDWSQHQLVACDDMPQFRFEIPGQKALAVYWTLISGHTVVTGDFGSWVFERQFWPGPDARISAEYMLMNIVSAQRSTVWDHDTLLQEIDDLMRDPDLSPEEADYLDNLRSYDEEYAYRFHAYDQPPGRFANDPDSIPRGEETHPQLKIVLEAFQEMCGRTEVRVEHPPEGRA